MASAENPDLSPDVDGVEDDRMPLGFELRLSEGRAFVSASGRPLGEGVVARHFAMEIPHVRFPFDVSGGAERFRNQRCTLRELEIAVDGELLQRWFRERLSDASLGLTGIELFPRTGFLEIRGQQSVAGSFTGKIGLIPEGRELLVHLYDLRLYAPGPLSAAELLQRLVAEPVRQGTSLVAAAGPTRLRVDLLGVVLQRLLVGKGFKMPDVRGVLLRHATIGQGQVVLGFGPAEMSLTPPSPEQLIVIDGERALAQVEAFIAEGQQAKARRQLMAQAPESMHPLAAERLLQLMASERDERDLALDLCALFRRRDPPLLSALWVEATLREAEGMRTAAAGCLLALAEQVLPKGELFSAAVAARQAAKLAESEATPANDELAARAFSLWETAAPQDVEALSGLANVAERRGDLPAAMSALRRVAAYGDGTHMAASAHARLGRLLLEKTDDVVRARLHLDQALRLEPESRQTILALADACLRSSEPMRAIRLLDQAADLAERDGALPESVDHRLRSGQVWEEQLLRPENAVLRYRDAADLARRAGLAQLEYSAIRRLAAVCQTLGMWTEALEAQRILSERSPAGHPRAVALLAQARLLLKNVPDREASDRLCARALREDPDFLDAALELCALRRGGPAEPLLEALTQASALSREPKVRAGLLAERGALEARESKDDVSAMQAFREALQIDSQCEPALLGAAEIAERSGQFAESAMYLETLSKLQPAEARRETLVRLALIAERLDDPAAAARALALAAADPQAPLSVLAQLLAAQRRRGLWLESDELALRVSEQAEREGDATLAAEVLIAQLDDPIDLTRAATTEKISARLERLLPSNAFSRWARVRLARLGQDNVAMRDGLVALLEMLPQDAGDSGWAEVRLPPRLAIYRELGEVSRALGELAQAADAYRAVCRLDPQDAEAWTARADLEGLLDHPREEAACLERLAELLQRRGEPVTAAAHLIQAARLQLVADPGAARRNLMAASGEVASPESLAELAALSEQLGDVGTASRALVKLAPALSDSSQRARTLRRAAMLSTDSAEAIRAARLSAEADPSFPWGRIISGLLALESGDATAAHATLVSLLSAPLDSIGDPLEPIEEALAEGLAWSAARQLGDPVAERAALERVLQREPESLPLLQRRVELLRSDPDAEPELLRGLRELAPRLTDLEAADALAELGERLANRGEPALAEQSFAAALRRAPTDARALIGTLRFLPFDDEGRPDLLARLLARPEELAHLDVKGEALGQLWSEHAARLDPSDPSALDAWRAATLADRGDLQAPYQWAKLLEATGQAAQAAEAYRELFERKDRAGAPDAWASALKAGELLRGAGLVPEASALVAQALERHPPPNEALQLLSLLALLQKDLGGSADEADTLAKLLALAPPERRADLHARRAEILRHEGDREGERAALQQAVISRPRDLQLLEPLGEVQLALGDFEGAVETLEQIALTLLPDRRAAAIAEVQRGKLAEERLAHGTLAEAAYRRALVLDPDQLDAHRYLGELLIARPDADSVNAGLGLLAEALRRSGSSPEAFASLARRAHTELGQVDFALSLLRPLLADEDSPEAAQVLGAELLYLGGALTEALPLLRRLSLRPFTDEPELHERSILYLAETAAQLGEVDEGLASLERLLAEYPQNRRALSLFLELLRQSEPGEAAARLLALAPSLEANLQATATGAAAELLLASQPQRALQLFADLGDRAGLRAALGKVGDRAGLRQALDQDLARARERGDDGVEIEALRSLIELHRAEGNGPEEVRSLLELVDALARTHQEEDEVQTRSLLGELLEHQGDGERALSVYLDGTWNPAGTKLIAPAEALARTLGRWNTLADLLARKLELASSPEVKGHRAEWALELASLCEGPLGDLERAERTLRRAFDEDEENLRVGEKLSEVYARAERFGELGELQLRRARAAEHDGRTSHAGELYGLAGENLLRPDDPAFKEHGLEALLRSLEFSRVPERVLMAADALYAKGERDAAADLYREVCQNPAPPFRALDRVADAERLLADPLRLATFLDHHASEAEFPVRWFLQASRAFGRAGDGESQARAASSAFDLDPENDAALAALVSTGNFAQPEHWVGILRRRAAAVPAESVASLCRAGEVLLAAGRLLEATEVFAQALETAPEDPDAMAGKIEALWAAQGEAAGNEIDVLGARLGQVLEASPEPFRHAAAALCLGSIALTRGRLEEARRGYEAAMRSSPLLAKSQGVLRALDEIYGQLGLREPQLSVRADLYRALREGVEDPSVETLRAELDRALAILQPTDAQAADLLQEVWEISPAPHAVELAQSRADALAAARRWNELADWLLRLCHEPLSPPLDAAARVRFCLWAADVSAQQLFDRPAAERARRLARDEAGEDVALLRELERSTRQSDPPLWLDVLAALARHADEPEKSSLLLERARAADALLPPAGALGAWEDVLRQGPGTPGYLQALERRLRSALEEGRITEAVDALLAESEAAVDPHARSSLLQKAAQLREERLHDLEGAIELYRRSAAESAVEKGFTHLAEAYDRMGRPAEAAAALAVEITRREPGERKRERQRKLGLLLARELASPKDALPHLTAALQGGEGDIDLLTALAGSARAVGDLPLELSALSQLTGEDPGDARELRRAEVLKAMGRDAEVVECLSRILRAHPANDAAFDELSQLLEQRKGWRELASCLLDRAEAVAGSGDSHERVSLLTRRGDILRSELQDPSGAETAYRAALAVDPEASVARAGLQMVFEERGDTASTAGLLRQEWDSTPTESRSIEVGIRLGGLLLTLGESLAASEVLQQAAALAQASRDPVALPQVQRLLVHALLALGQPQEALAVLIPAERRWSAELIPEVWALMGKAKLALGQQDEAVDLFRRALSMQPGIAEAVEGLTAAGTTGSPTMVAEALQHRLAAEEVPAAKAALWRSLAELQLTELDDRAGAEESLRASAAIEPDDDRTFEHLQELLEPAGRLQELADILKQRARGLTDDRVRSRVLCELGDLLRTRLRDPPRAADAYQRSLELVSVNPLATEGLAESLLALGRDEEAAPLYRRTLSGGGHLGEFFLHFRLGEIARRAGDGPQAMDQFQRSTEQNPAFLPASDALVAIAEELGASEVGLAALRARVAMLDPQEFAEQVADAYLKIAEIEKRALRFEAALEALEHAVRLRPGDRRVLELLAAMYQNRSRWPEAVRVLVLLADLTDGASRSSALTAAGEIALDKLADMERAEPLFERALAINPGQERATRRIAEIAAALERHEKLASIADAYLTSPGRAVPSWLEELWVPLATAYEREGRLEDAYAVIGRAREKAPADLGVLQRQAELARKLGRLGDESNLEESLIQQVALERPLEGASRLRALARSVLDQLDDAQRAEQLLERANALAPARPEDRRLLADLQRRHPEGREAALAAYLDLAREEPTEDIVLLRVLAATAESLDRPELAQTARGLALALEGGTVGSAPSLTPFDPSSWSLGALAAATPLEIAMQSLAPYTEPLFPAQLHRFGVTGADRVGPGHAPELHQWIERVRESLGARPIEVLLAQSTSGVAVENTQPPSLIVGNEAPAALGQAGMQFLACQRLALIELGLTLPAKFSPRDVTTLATLVTLFITNDPSLFSAERRRLAPFLDALEQTCPEPLRAGLGGHASAAAAELSRFDPNVYMRNGSARAHRIALLVTGDLCTGLQVFDYLDRGTSVAPGRPWELPQGRALVAWAFSDEHLALRRAALGKSPIGSAA